MTDFWPTSFQSGLTKQKERWGNKRVHQEHPCTSPTVEPGSLTAATLRLDSSRRFSWAFAVENVRESRLLKSADPCIISPPTRAVAPRAHRTAAKQDAEQGANFIRTRYPDVDIPAELLRDELSLDQQRALENSSFDPHSASLLNIITTLDERGRPMPQLAFPSGETFNTLALLPLSLGPADGPERYSPRSHIAQPWVTFPTPIQQVAAPANLPDGLQRSLHCLLAVRTMGGVHVMNWSSPSPDSMDVPPGQLFQLSRTDMGDRPAVDLGLCISASPSLLAINDRGELYGYDIGERGVSLPGSRLFTMPETSSGDYFFKVRHAAQPQECLVASSSKLIWLDLRASNAASTVYSNTSTKSVLCSVDHGPEEHIVRVVTCDNIHWIDRRFSGRSLLGHKHGRQFDRTLSMQTIPMISGPLTFLTSMKNGMVTVYDVNMQRPLHFNTLPYLLRNGFPPGHNFGSAVFSAGDGLSCRIFGLAPNGSLRGIDCSLAEDFDTEQSQDLAGNEENDALCADVSQTVTKPLEQQEHSLVDMEPVYHTTLAVAGTSDGYEPDAVYQVIENMTDFWQANDANLDNMLTMFDVAFRSIEEPKETGRADFLAENPLNTGRGFQTMAQARIPRASLRRDAPWHHDFRAFIQTFNPEFDDDVPNTLENLRALDRQDDAREPDDAKDRAELEARQQLALDVFLASDVFAARPVDASAAARDKDMKPDDALETMSLATMALSLGDSELPPTRFSVLRPDFRRDGAGTNATSTSEDVAEEPEPTGIRHLLAEWRLGEDPGAYEYPDLLLGTLAPGRPPAGRQGRAPDGMTTGPSQRPPAIAARREQPPSIVPASQPLPSARPRAHASQFTDAPISRAAPPATQLPPQSQSQPKAEAPMPSTQVLPGRYGGRPEIARKKSAKKRLGGF